MNKNAESSVLLDAQRACTVRALGAERQRLILALQEVDAAFQDLGGLYARALQLPADGTFRFVQEAGGVRLVVVEEDDEREA